VFEALSFTGDVEMDFSVGAPSFAPKKGVIRVDDAVIPDVGVPPGPLWVDRVSGWDIKSLYFQLDRDTGALHIGINCFGVCGDADGDGDAGRTSLALTVAGGVDHPDFAFSESFALGLDFGGPGVNLAGDGQMDFVIGYPASLGEGSEPFPCGDLFNITCFGLYFFQSGHLDKASTRFVFAAGAYDRFAAGVLALVWRNAVDHNGKPDRSKPDLEWSINNFNTVRQAAGFDQVDLNAVIPWEMNVLAFAGSFQDDGIGEDVLPNNEPFITVRFPRLTTASQQSTTSSSLLFVTSANLEPLATTMKTTLEVAVNPSTLLVVPGTTLSPLPVVPIAVGAAVGGFCLFVLIIAFVCFARRYLHHDDLSVTAVDNAHTSSFDSIELASVADGAVASDGRRSVRSHVPTSSDMRIIAEQVTSTTDINASVPMPGTTTSSSIRQGKQTSSNEVYDVVPDDARAEKSSNSNRINIKTKSNRSAVWRIATSDIKLEKKLGEGAFGIVWKGRWHGKAVAVKQVKADTIGGVAAVADFELEIGNMASLQQHENLVTFYGVTTLESGDVAAVVEFCAGGSLMDALYGKHARGWTQERQIKIAHDAACGLAHLHRLGVIHRDVAARNVLLAKHGVAKFADFGMARSIDENEREQQTTNAVGPLKWMAPEQMERCAYSKASDVFSFGVLLFEIFARDAPWNGMQVMVAAKNVMNGKRMEPPDDAPVQVQQLMRMCWAHKSKRRPEMHAIQSALETLSERSGTSSESQDRAESKRFATFEISSDALIDLIEIGAGSFGRVFKAEYHHSTVAVKCVNKDAFGANTDIEAEVLVLSQLPTHANVVAFRGVTEIDQRPAIVLEYCEGGSLQAALCNTTREWTNDKKLAVACGTAAGLAHLHKCGIVHRDIAARNVLLGENGIAKVTDFGMAKSDVAHNNRTVSDMGATAWMAPEQLQRGTMDQKFAYSKQSDVFAFGVLLFELFEQTTPWLGFGRVDIVKRVTHGERLATSSDAYPSGVLDLMREQCWVHNAHDRATMDEVVLKLKNANVSGALQAVGHEYDSDNGDNGDAVVVVATNAPPRKKKKKRAKRLEIADVPDSHVSSAIYDLEVPL